jgi:hypothetical protein
MIYVATANTAEKTATMMLAIIVFIVVYIVMLFHKNDQSATEADWSDKFIKKPLAVCQKILKNKIWAPVIKFRNPPSRNAESPYG